MLTSVLVYLMEKIMRVYCKVILSVLIAVVLNASFAMSVFSGPSAGKSIEQKNKSYTMVAGMLAIKEGHGDFLIRLPNGETKRFKAKKEAEITRNGKQAGYSELKIRDSIQVQYDSSTRTVIAIHANGS